MSGDHIMSKIKVLHISISRSLPSSSMPSSNQRMGMRVSLILLRSSKLGIFWTFMLIWILALALSVVPVTCWMSNQKPCLSGSGVRPCTPPLYLASAWRKWGQERTGGTGWREEDRSLEVLGSRSLEELKSKSLKASSFEV